MPEPSEVRLTEWTTCGGCAAKWGASLLRELLEPFGQFGDGVDPDLLVGLAPSDDAAVYRLTDDLALVTTTDFFPPVVDDPADFGAIAAANACSDVFAMGGRVVLALNVAAFPEHLPRDVVATILDSARSVVVAAGGMVGGGHTIRSDEPIFGLAVSGLVHPDHVFRKGSARPGQVVVLSKPLGTGLVLAGGRPSEKAAAAAGMRELNRSAAEALAAVRDRVGAVTDVTGFGLAGHAGEVAERSGVELVVDVSSLPPYEGALDAAGRGTRTGGDARNRESLDGRVRIGEGVGDAAQALVFDPQTSGGLLATVDDHPTVLAQLADLGFEVIGSVEPPTAGGPLVTLVE